MRNLKRALSLALALVMVLSMMVVGAGAVSIDDFTDADEIVNTEAVTTMVSLGVIDGNDDGSYNPTGTVKRGEMAKLIAVMLNGGKDPTLGAMPVTFSDTTGHWAQNYISYVANLHIIDGRGDGTFGPNDDVTGSEAAKMILTALGYRSDLEGFTGANWAINVQSVANQIDLFDGLAINPDEGLSRDDTAQMLYNAVQADMVEYRNLEGSYDGIVYPQPVNGNGANANSTVLWEKFKVTKVTGVVEATSLIALNAGATTVEGKTRLNDIELNGSGEDANGNPWNSTVYPIAVDSEYLGYRVVIYVKGLNALAPNASNMEVVGDYIISDDNTVVTTTGRLKDADAVKDALKGSGIAVSGGQSEINITEDDTTWAYTTALGTVGTRTGGVQGMPGVTQTFIDNDADGYVEVIVAKNPALAKINTYNESKETVNISGIGTVDFVDILNPEDVAQGDYVLVYNYDDTYVLAQAESVSGVVSAYVNNKDNVNLSKITIDGTNYGKGSGNNLAPDVTTVNPAVLTDLVDGTYTLYLDPNGNMLGYVEDAAAIGSYAVITGVNATGNMNFRSVEVKLLMADGSTGKYDVNLLASTKKWGEGVLGLTSTSSDFAREEAMFAELRDNGLNKLVTYSMDGNTVTLGTAASTTNYGSASTAAALELKNSKSGYVFNEGTLMADDNTAIFIKDAKGDYSVVKGLKNLPSDALDTTGVVTAIYYKPTGSKTMTARAIFAEVTRNFTSNSNYAFITSDYTKTIVGSDTIYTYTVVDENGDTLDLKSKSDDWVDKTWVQEYQLDGEYVIFGDTDRMINEQVVLDTGSNAVSVASADDGVTGETSYPVPASAKIWNVEDTDNIFPTTLQKYDEVALVLDEDGNVKTAYVYDRLDGDMAPVANNAMTVKNNNGSVMGTLVDNAADIYGVVNNQKLSVEVTAEDGQTVTVSATKNGSKLTLANDGKFDNSKGDKDPNTHTFDIYEYTAAEDGTKIVVTINVAQDGYATRTIEYTLTLWSGAAAITAPTVELAQPGTGAADLTSAPVPLTEGADKSTDATVTYEAGKNKLYFDVTPIAGTVKSLSLTTPDGKTSALATTGFETGVFTVAATGTYTLTVVMEGANVADQTFVYNVKIASTYKDVEPLEQLNVVTNASNTGEFTFEVAGEKPDQTAGLKDGSVGNNMFTAYNPTNGDKATALRVMIPVTDAQAEASKSTGIAIKQTNASLKDGWSGGDIDSGAGTKDKVYSKPNIENTEDSSYVWENGQRYIALWVVVSEASLEDGVKIEVKFNTSDDFDTGSYDADLIINVDLSQVTFQ